jgi:hypothetical protein
MKEKGVGIVSNQIYYLNNTESVQISTTPFEVIMIMFCIINTHELKERRIYRGGNH